MRYRKKGKQLGSVWTKERKSKTVGVRERGRVGQRERERERERQLNNSEEWIMTVLIDWNMVRWLLSINWTKLYTYIYFWLLCGLLWVSKKERAGGREREGTERLKYLTDTLVHFRFSYAPCIEWELKCLNNEAVLGFLTLTATLGCCCHRVLQLSWAVPQTSLTKKRTKKRTHRTKTQPKSQWNVSKDGKRANGRLLPQYFIFFLKCQFMYLKDTLSRHTHTDTLHVCVWRKETPWQAVGKWKKWIFDRFMTIEPSSFFELLPSK